MKSLTKDEKYLVALYETALATGDLMPIAKCTLSAIS